MTKKSFFLIIQDRDKKLFAVEGPTTDDSRWSMAVVTERAKGRNMACDAIPVNLAATAEVAARQFKAMAVEYAQVPSFTLIPPESFLK